MYLHREYSAQIMFQLLATSIVHGLASPIIAPQTSTLPLSIVQYRIVQCTDFYIFTSPAYNSNYMAYNSNYIPMIYRVASFMILVGRQFQVTCFFGKPRSHWGNTEKDHYIGYFPYFGSTNYAFYISLLAISLATLCS